MNRQNVVDMHRHTGASGPCPSSEDLANHFINGDRHRIADHLQRCNECREVVRAIEPFRDFRQAIAVGVGSHSEARRKRRLAAIAASVLIVAGASMLLADWTMDRGGRPFRAVDIDRTRSAPPPSVVTRPTHQSVLTTPPAQIQFENAGRARVTVELFDERLLPVWKSPTVTEEVVSLPASVRESMRPGATFLWQVQRTEGVSSTTSPLYSFSIQGQQERAVDRRDPTRRSRSRREGG